MILGKPGRKLSAAFPFASLLFFSVIRYAAYLRLPATDISWTYDLSESPALGTAAQVLYALHFMALVFGLCALVVVSSS